jgi:Uma2 family endonuclease
MQIAEKKKYTAKDYMTLEEGAPFQLINYDLIMSPSPSLQHQLVLGEFYETLKIFNRTHSLNGLVILSPMDIHFDEGNIFQPDLAFIKAERVNTIVKERIEGAPDLVIEVISPSSAYYDLRHKKYTYEKFGVKEYIVVDPIAETAELYSLENGLYTLHQIVKKPANLNSVLLTGLSFDLNKIFQ